MKKPSKPKKKETTQSTSNKLEWLLQNKNREAMAAAPSAPRSRGNRLTFKVGDVVYVKPDQAGEESYIANIVKIVDNKVQLRWYYRPEDARGGRQVWHGSKEMFKSNHLDWNYLQCIEGRCHMHTLEEYENLDGIGDADFFSRFEYCVRTSKFTPDIVPIYCLCELPHNPDLFMIECEKCLDWFHPECVGIQAYDDSTTRKFTCPNCKYP